MQPRILFSLFLLMGLSGAAIAFEHNLEGRSDTLVIEVPETTHDHFNWFRAGADLHRGAYQAMLEPLFMWQPESHTITPWLAESFTYSETGDVITIKLKKRVRWSDNARFDANDVVYSIQTAISSTDFDGKYARRLRRSVKAVERVSRYSIRLTLMQPDPNLVLEAFAASDGGSFSIVPEHVWRDEDPVAFDNPTPIGTGPYKLVRGEKTVWMRNLLWHRTNLKRPLRLSWVSVGTEEERLTHLASGALDASAPISLAAFRGVAAARADLFFWSKVDPIDGATEACALTVEFDLGEVSPVAPPVRLAVHQTTHRRAVAHGLFSDPDLASGYLFRNHPKNQSLAAALRGLTAPVSGDIEGARVAVEEAGCVEIPVERNMSCTADLQCDEDAETCTVAPLAACRGANEPVCGGIYGMEQIPLYQCNFDGTPEILEVPILVNGADPQAVQGARTISRQLCRTGIFSKVDEAEPDAISGLLERGEFSAHLAAPSCDRDVSVGPHLAYLTDGASKWSGDAADAFANALTAAKSEVTLGPEHEGQLVEAYGHALSDLPMSPVTQEQMIVPMGALDWAGIEGGYAPELWSQNMQRLWPTVVSARK